MNGYDDQWTTTLAEKPAVKVANRSPRDLTTYGYQVTPGYNSFLQPQVNWDFHSIDYWNEEQGRQVRIGVFGVMRPGGGNYNVLRVHEIWAGRDQRPTGERAAFHDDVISFWRLAPLHRNLNALTEIRFDTIIEDSLNNIVEWVYQTMGCDQNYGLLVRRDGDRANEQDVFRTILARSRFAIRMQQAIREYAEFSHRRIMAFYFSGGVRNTGFDFAIYFDGYNPATVGDATWNW